MQQNADLQHTDTEALAASVTGFLASYGESLAEGVLPRIAECYAYPSAIITGEGTIVVSGPKDIEAAFGVAVQQYVEKGPTQ